MIASGETTVKVRGGGRGWSQSGIRARRAASNRRRHARSAVVLASAGTDGIDGPTDAAGAIVDTTTTDARGTREGFALRRHCKENAAYDFFEPLGDLIIWGPTGTNVGDLHVC